jgi:DNA repair ATPase RecN
LTLDLDDASEQVSRQFKGEITNNQEMSELRLSLQKALQDVLQRLLASFEAGVNELCQQLDNIRDALANELANDLRQELESLKVSFNNKERELEAYSDLLARCNKLAVD